MGSCSRAYIPHYLHPLQVGLARQQHSVDDASSAQNMHSCPCRIAALHHLEAFCSSELPSLTSTLLHTTTPSLMALLPMLCLQGAVCSTGP